ncbi:MAG: tRNA (adenosine(37)-N6)-dimethylallyltransferase MiaA [Bacteroidales bacterium]|nr:tRNA (adenosine(37)-N6)-dimethylallyltransferase MiaA [Bacteroidales bacterium]
MSLPNPNLLVVITGPTATGKTRLAACVAAKCEGEVISADSRQVYRGMDVGTGKDLHDFMVDDLLVPYHLVDIVDPGYEYNVFEFQQDFIKALKHIQKRRKQPVLCGGTGLYIEAALKGYALQKVEPDPELRQSLQLLTNEELSQLLAQYRPLHNTTDTTDRERLIRAIEIGVHQKNQAPQKTGYPAFKPIIFGIHFERKVIRQRITERLSRRLETGMLDEINRLLSSGLKPEQLKFYGLEYRILTQYVTGEISYDEMFTTLNTAIHQFAKRQMTWFRRMERNGLQINWIDGNLSIDEKVDQVLEKIGFLS